MKGLILKDIIILKKNVKIMFAAAAFYAVMSFTQGDPSFFSSLFTLLFAILILTTYSLDEYAKWDGYGITLPVTREDIIKSKYALVVIVAFLGMILSSVFIMGYNVFTKQESILAGVEGAVAGAAIVLAFYSIILPIITKLGVEKTRLVMIVICVVPLLIGSFIKKSIEQSSITVPASIIHLWNTITDHIYLFAPLVLIIVMGISYNISVQIYKKKEF